MKEIGRAFVVIVLIFFLSLILVAPIISKRGYSSVEGSYHGVTHALLFTLIFLDIICTTLILEELKEIKNKDHNGREIICCLRMGIFHREN